MARVSLVNPALFLECDPYARKSDPKIPLGLLYLAAALEQQGHYVQLIDAAFEGFTSSQIITLLKDFKPDYVGFTCVSVTQEVVIELARLVKITMHTPKIIIGGIQPTLDPVSFLMEEDIDYVLSGEGEYSLITLCSEDTDLDNIDGLSYKDNDGKLVLAKRPSWRIHNLDALPYPAYHLLDLERYFQKRRTICMLASRGCIFDCSYCASSSFWGKRIIFRSPENVFGEITSYLERYPGVRNYHFLDDNFTAWGRDLLIFCNLVKELEIRWRCVGCIENLRKETIEAMAASGCYSISFGVESGSDKIQWSCRKQLDLELLPKKIELLRDSGIHTKAFFMFGFPDETREDIFQTIRYSLLLKHHGLEDAAFMPLVPYPGTDIYISHIKNNVCGFGDIGRATDWLDTMPAVASKMVKYRTYPLISANELFEGLQLRLIAKKAYELFYSSGLSETLASSLEKFINNEIY